MSKHDLEAMVNHTLKVTESEQLYYVGHSQGTTIMFGKLAMKPDFANRVSKHFQDC